MRLTRRPPAFDLDDLRRRVGQVRDPELGIGLDEAGMLGEVEAHGRIATVVVRLTTSSCPLRERLLADVTAAATVPGVDRVEVRFTEMTADDRRALSTRLRSGRSAAPFAADGPTKVYAVASGKGGVGKSSVTANLAAALAAGGRRVGILDADVWGYSIPALYGVRRAPVALEGVMLPIEANGVALMSVGFFIGEDEAPVVWRGPMLHKAIEQFLGDVHWGDLDVLLIDLPPGTGDVTISLLELVPDAQLIVVTTPQPAASNVAARVGRMARDTRMPIAGVVENMTSLVCHSCGDRQELFGSGGGQALAEALAAPLLGQIPLDVALRRAGDRGNPVVLSAPAAASAMELRRIASTLPVVRRSLVGRPLPLTVV